MQDATVARFAAMLAALSQPTRLRIVKVVAANGPQGTPAGEIARAVHCPASTLSFHLKELSQAGVLSAEPQGRFIRYSVIPAALDSLAEYVRSLPGVPAPAPPQREPEPEPPARARRGSAGKKPKAARKSPSKPDKGQMSIFDE